MVAAVLVGVALGVIFAVSLLPVMKYPANPPGVGETETVTGRTLAYFSFIAVGIVILFAVHRLRGHLVARGWNPSWSVTAAAAAAVVLAGVALWAWPANPDPTPRHAGAAQFCRKLCGRNGHDHAMVLGKTVRGHSGRGFCRVPGPA